MLETCSRHADPKLGFLFDGREVEEGLTSPPPQTTSQRHRWSWGQKWAILSAFIPPTGTLSRDSQGRAGMEVLKEKVEEEEEAEREEAAERGEKMPRPLETRREEPPMTQEMLRDLEKKLSEIEIVILEQPLCASGWGLWARQPWRGSDRGRAKEEPRQGSGPRAGRQDRP